MGREHVNKRYDARGIAVLASANLLGGVALASGFAVGALLVERVGGTSIAGLGQAASVLGAAVAAIPLAGLAARRGRRRALVLGYGIAVAGGGLIVTAAVLSQVVLLLAGLALFGVGQAVNLQSRYAAADGAAPDARARTMSMVIWATTIGSATGPNLSEAADRLGRGHGLPALAGPFAFSALAFVVAGAVVAVFFRPAASAVRSRTAGDARTVGALAALKWAAAHPTARFAVVLIAVAHATMVMVMVMTPLHMQHHGMSLRLVGVVISLHVLGMYALSPVFGWLADRLGAVWSALGGMAMLVTAVVLGFVAASAPEGGALTALALIVLGLGWSASLISASALLAGTASDHVRLPLQGATDAGMNYAGAAAAALAGPIIAFGGFRAVNVAAAIILVPALAAAAAVLRRTARPHEPTAETGAKAGLETGVDTGRPAGA